MLTVRAHDDYLKVLKAAEGLSMELERDGKRVRVRNYLADILVIAEGTGRRIGAVRQLCCSDLIIYHIRLCFSGTVATTWFRRATQTTPSTSTAA